MGTTTTLVVALADPYGHRHILMIEELHAIVFVWPSLVSGDNRPSYLLGHNTALPSLDCLQDTFSEFLLDPFALFRRVGSLVKLCRNFGYSI